MQDDVFIEKLRSDALAVETLLAAMLSDDRRPGEIARPARLMAAIRHGVLNGGKRMRPALLLAAARLFGGDEDSALRLAAALECIHCYSLVHDDLPAMDDDDFRRGQPTVHKAFDEASAILAGDSLLTFAFEIVASPETRIEANIKAAIILAMAQAAGIGGMAGGQALDLDAETKSLGEDDITTLQAMKTGALLRFACEAGALAGGATDNDRARMVRFGEIIGLAFQLRDDLLDLTADAAVLGKAAGKDAARGKGTLPSIRGLAWTEARLAELIVEAQALLAPFGEKAAMLMALASYVANREK